MPAHFPNRSAPLVSLLGALAVALPSAAQEGEVETHYTSLETLPIEFEAKDLGPAGVALVELWVTTNDGDDWSQGPTSTDERGTFDYPAPAEGRYGFRVRTIDQAGNEEPRPVGGIHKPELVVVVDRKQPLLKVLRPAQGAALGAGRRAFVYWEASDENLGPAPVEVLYRPSPDSPWEALPGGPFGAEGQAAFDLPGQDLPEAAIAVEATDLAGNSAREERAFSVRTAPERALDSGPEPSREDALRRAYGFCNQGRTHFKLAEYERAEEAYRKALEAYPGLPVAHHDLGVVHYVRRNYDHAVQNFRAALKGEPDNAEYRYSLGVAYYQLGHDSDARDQLEQAFEAARRPDLRAEILWTLGLVHEREKRWSEARRAWERILEMGGSTRIDAARKKLVETQER
ncbi:MAG: tetratricopeptide repeat protein [Planctomycetes bacterium]|nr:tetratricopeptide repeat protein [Planctomycetota bacterium]